MGVYIDMEMPETCKLCYLSEFDPGFYAYVCKPTGIRIDYDMAKIDRPRTICPLIPVPPHGRLIDKDALEADISASVVFSGRDGNAEIVGAKKIINRLHLAPTIIPAEEGE